MLRLHWAKFVGDFLDTVGGVVPWGRVTRLVLWDDVTSIVFLIFWGELVG